MRKTSIARALALVALLLVVSARGLDAQAAPPAGLRPRMNAFLRALRDQAPMPEIAAFFPQRAEWELVRAPNHAGAPATDLRFRPDETLSAIREGGRVCDSFGGVVGDVAAYGGVIVLQAMGSPRWKYVGTTRFVPTGKDASPMAYVEWMREGGAWVIARIGEETYYEPHVVGVPVVPATDAVAVTRDTSTRADAPPERRFALGMAWFESNVPLRGGGTWLKYGVARPVDVALLERFGAVGTVPVFQEIGAHGEVLYVPVTPGNYQPYQSFGHSVCRD